jgi:hypothetical protein
MVSIGSENKVIIGYRWAARVRSEVKKRSEVKRRRPAQRNLKVRFRDAGQRAVEYFEAVIADSLHPWMQVPFEPYRSPTLDLNFRS